LDQDRSNVIVFLNNCEDAEWNFEIHENATEIDGLEETEVALDADGCVD
jgi:hypothetical protein